MINGTGSVRWCIEMGDSGSWSVPHDIRAEGGCLVWRGASYDGRVIDADAAVTDGGETLLREFVRLADSRDSAIVEFARQYGPLYLCAKHRRPLSHIPLWVRRHVNEEIPWCQVARRGLRGPHYESLDDWRRTARQASVVIEAAAQLAAAKPTPLSLTDWQPCVDLVPAVAGLVALHDRIGRHDYLPPQNVEPGQSTARIVDPKQDAQTRRRLHTERVDQQRSLLADVVTVWLHIGGVAAAVHDNNTPAGIRHPTGTLYGAIGVQLALTLANSDGVVRCDSCAKPFSPTRRPRADRAVYCDQPKCKLEAKRAWARRNRQTPTPKTRP